MFNLIKIVFFCVSIIMGVIGVKLYKSSKMKLETYATCRGRIERFIISRTGGVGKDNRKSISTVVSYLVDARRYEFTSGYYSSSMKEGQEVEVMYSREDPSKAAIKSGLFVAPAILGVLAVVFLLLAIIFCFVPGRGLGLF